MGASNYKFRQIKNEQPLESATREFSLAFEQILGETVSKDIVITYNKETDTSRTKSTPI